MQPSKRYAKAGAHLPDFRMIFQPRAIRLTQLLGDIQAQTGTVSRSGEKRLKQFTLVLNGNTGAIILHIQYRPAIRHTHRQRQAAGQLAAIA
jgi:hypothetical protein